MPPNTSDGPCPLCEQPDCPGAPRFKGICPKALRAPTHFGGPSMRPNPTPSYAPTRTKPFLHPARRKKDAPTPFEQEVLDVLLLELRRAMQLKGQLSITIDPHRDGSGANIFASPNTEGRSYTIGKKG